jgi:hypothetical protein
MQSIGGRGFPSPWRLVAVGALLAAMLAGAPAPASATVPADLERHFGTNGVIVSASSDLRLPTVHDLFRDRGGNPLGSRRELHPPGSPLGCGYDVHVDELVPSDGSVERTRDFAVGEPCSAPVPSQVAFGQDGLGGFYLATGDGSGLRLTRTLEDGTIDPTFGNAGVVTIAAPQPLQPLQLSAWSLGDVVIAGTASPVPGGGSANAFLARVRPDGTLDPSFRGGGLSLFDDGRGGPAREPSALVVDSEGGDGNIYLAGPLQGTRSAGRQTVAGVEAFLPDGRPDPDFGRGGFVRLPGRSAPAMVLARKRILVASNGVRPGIATLTRLTETGKRDEDLGGDGSVELSAKRSFRVAEMAVDGGARIVLAGTRQAHFAVDRLEWDGRQDRTFAGGGVFYLDSAAKVPFGAPAVEGLYVSSGNAGGGIVVSGSIEGFCAIDCDRSPSWDLRFRLEGQTSHERCDFRRATIVGTSRGERLVGTRRADTIVGLGGNDTIVGGRGNDYICGGPGRDVLKPGPGRNHSLPEGR